MATAAPSEDAVDRAFARAKQLLEEAAAAKSQLSSLQTRIQEAAERVQRQESEVEKVSSDLSDTRREVARLTHEFDRVRELLGQRAAEVFMHGDVSTVSILLGSESMTQFADRLEFVSIVAERDVDLANDVTNARFEMEVKAADLAALRRKEQEALTKIRRDERALQANMARQQDLVAEIEGKEAEASRYAKQLDQQRQRYLDSLVTPPATDGGSGFDGPLPPGASVFRACPVDQPRVVTDSFGAPRYVGGSHPHKGNDIMAPSGTAIRAPFDGYARDASNWSGGLAVIVEGANGYVYNAHLSRIDRLGSVSAGTVIGYVGMTGASGAGVNHNHFEYHPNVTPSSWPTSSYGYSIIGDAVNPYPLLGQVC